MAFRDQTRRLHTYARGQAARRGIGFDLTLQDVRDLVKEAGGRCQVSGAPFSNELWGKARTRPWVPSLDRIESSVHYTRENVRLVCYAVNNALGEWGDDLLIQLARQITLKNQHGN